MMVLWGRASFRVLQFWSLGVVARGLAVRFKNRGFPVGKPWQKTGITRTRTDMKPVMGSRSIGIWASSLVFRGRVLDSGFGDSVLCGRKRLHQRLSQYIQHIYI